MKRARTRADLNHRAGMTRTPQGTWITRRRDTALAFQRDNGGILLVEADEYHVCCGGCDERFCQCRGDLAHIKSLAPSWDESHPDNAGRTRGPCQPTLF